MSFLLWFVFYVYKNDWLLVVCFVPVKANVWSYYLFLKLFQKIMDIRPLKYEVHFCGLRSGFLRVVPFVIVWGVVWGSIFWNSPYKNIYLHANKGAFVVFPEKYGQGVGFGVGKSSTDFSFFWNSYCRKYLKYSLSSVLRCSHESIASGVNRVLLLRLKCFHFVFCSMVQYGW